MGWDRNCGVVYMRGRGGGGMYVVCTDLPAEDVKLGDHNGFYGWGGWCGVGGTGVVDGGEGFLWLVKSSVARLCCAVPSPRFMLKIARGTESSTQYLYIIPFELTNAPAR